MLKRDCILGGRLLYILCRPRHRFHCRYSCHLWDDRPLNQPIDETFRIFLSLCHFITDKATSTFIKFHGYFDLACFQMCRQPADGADAA